MTKEAAKHFFSIGKIEYDDIFICYNSGYSGYSGSPSDQKRKSVKIADWIL